MLNYLKKAANAVHDWALPHCDKCGKRAFPHNHCSLCDAICGENRADEIKENYSQHGRTDSRVSNASFVCDTCFISRELAKCEKTGIIFNKSANKLDEFYGSKLFQNMAPYHPSSRISDALSEEGLAIIVREHTELQGRLRNWAGCSKQDFLRGHRIINEIGLIREDDDHDDPAEVEEALKWHCVQIGGNGLIKFFWDKHVRHHEEEYVAGYGNKGNPYYRTRRWTTAHFSGHAVAVVAEPTSVSSKRGDSGGNGGWGRRDGPKGPPPGGPAIGTEAYYASILGLKGKCSREDVKSAYRRLMADYHPDKVAHLGSELRELALKKAKALNEAYEFFRKKYKI